MDICIFSAQESIKTHLEIYQSFFEATDRLQSNGGIFYHSGALREELETEDDCCNILSIS